MSSAPSRLGPTLVLAALGACLLSGLGQLYRIDQHRCPDWPSLRANLAAAVTFGVAVALLSIAWLRWLRQSKSPDGPSTRAVLACAAILYVLAGLGPPALSDDPLFYAAIGRALAGGHSPAQPLCQSLPPDDALLQLLVPHWRCGNSAYLAGFHAVASIIAAVAKNDLVWHLRGHQIVAGLSMLGGAGLTALALRGSSLRPAYGAVLVALNPLSIVEAAGNAHNDALLALATGGLVLAYSRRHLGGTLLSAGLALSVKASAVLVALFLPAASALRWLRRRVGPPSSHLHTLGLAVAALLGLILAGALLLHLRPVALFGPSHLPWEHCTRSLECLPRSILRAILQKPEVAGYVAVGFRLLSAVWLAYAAYRAGESPSQRLAWMGAGLLIYYLYLHPWSQSWYLLSLLPLSPWLRGRYSRALRSLSISATAYYALVFIGNCLQDELAIAVTDLIEGLIVMVPPTISLLRTTTPQPMAPASLGASGPTLLGATAPFPPR